MLRAGPECADPRRRSRQFPGRRQQCHGMGSQEAEVSNPHARSFREAAARLRQYEAVFPWGSAQSCAWATGCVERRLGSGAWIVVPSRSVASRHVLTGLWSAAFDDSGSAAGVDVWPDPSQSALDRAKRSANWVQRYDPSAAMDDPARCASAAYLAGVWRREKDLTGHACVVRRMLAETAEAMDAAVEGAPGYAGPRPVGLFSRLSRWALDVSRCAAGLRAMVLSEVSGPSEHADRRVADARARLAALAEHPVCPSLAAGPAGLAAVSVDGSRFVMRSFDHALPGPEDVRHMSGAVRSSYTAAVAGRVAEMLRSAVPGWVIRDEHGSARPERHSAMPAAMVADDVGELAELMRSCRVLADMCDAVNELRGTAVWEECVWG